MAVSSTSVPKVKTSDLEKTKWPAKLAGKEDALQTLKALYYGNLIDDNFDSPLTWSNVNNDPAVMSASVGGGAILNLDATVPAAGIERSFRSRKATYEQHIAIINGTAVWSSPLACATGLYLQVDGNVTNGILSYEITNGCLANSYAARTVGTSPDSFFEVQIKGTTIANVKELVVGWRKAETYRVDPDDYDEAAAFNLGAGAEGRINTWTILNNGATTTTNTGITALTDATLATGVTLRVVVRSNGKTEFYVNGTRYQPAAQFTFDSAEVVVPFLHLEIQTGDPALIVNTWRCGWL